MGVQGPISSAIIFPKMQVIIVTAPADIDAISIEIRLRSKGVDAHRVFFSELGHTQSLSYTLPQEGLSLTTAEKKQLYIEPDIVWMRRPRPPNPADNLDAQDAAVVHAENVNAAHAILHSLSHKVRFINNMTGRDQARSKMLQLKLAQGLNIKIPETLVTNIKKDILDFMERDTTPVVMKTFSPIRYYEGDSIKPVYATQISPEDLADEPEILDQVSIFQKRVPKAYEIRALFLGGHVVAVKLDTQAHELGEIDSRRAMTVENELAGHQVELPQSVKAACINLMRKMDIVTASFDFIVTPDDDYIFLEFNETGQCIFLEQYENVPNVLETYCEFLIHSGDPFEFYPQIDPSAPNGLSMVEKSRKIAKQELTDYKSRASQVNAIRL
jgi:glutathione synthase/RimK-type ligase-like ATP-grasp enzyme